MEKYWIYLRLILTIIIVAIPVVYFILWLLKHTKKIWSKTKEFIQEKQHKQQIRKELKDKKESIINPKIDNEHTDEDFQEVIETAIAEVNEQQETTEISTKKSEPIPEKIEEEKTSSLEENKNIPEKKEIDEKTKKQIEKIIVEANFLKNEGKFEDYEKKIIEGLALEPSNLELTKMLADLYFTLWSHKKALSLLKKIIERDPEDHKSLRQIGEIYFINGDNQTAELLVEKAINLKPDSPKYNLSLVEIYYNTERVNDAIACMEKIIKLRPANTNYLLTLAELYEEIQDIASAKKHYFSILEYEPSNERAKKKLKQYSE